MIPYIEECLLERALILSHSHSEIGWPVPCLTAFNFPGVATRYPFDAGWTVSEQHNYDPRVWHEPSMFCSAVKCSNHLVTQPSKDKSKQKQECHRKFLQLEVILNLFYTNIK